MSSLEYSEDAEGYDHERQKHIIKLDSARECGFTSEGENLDPILHETDGLNQYQDSPTFVYSFVWAIADFLSNIREIADGLFAADYNVGQTGHYLVTRTTPYSHDLCKTADCESEDLVDSYAATPEQEQLADDGGFVATFKPASIQYKDVIHGEQPNSYTTNLNESLDTDTRTHLTRLYKDSTNYLSCALMPQSQHQHYVDEYGEFGCQYRGVSTGVEDDLTCGTPINGFGDRYSAIKLRPYRTVL